VMVPADRVSTHDLPFAESLSAVERENYHNMKVYPEPYPMSNTVQLIRDDNP